MSSCISEEFSLLVQLLTRLPGMGPRSAKRAAFDLVKKRETLLEPLIKNLNDVHTRASLCQLCGHLDTHNPCLICSNSARDQGSLCIVEESLDVWTVERIGLHNGLYHVLGGTLSVMNNIGPQQLGIDKLVQRIQSSSIHEVTIAMSATIEGQTTVHYLLDTLKDKVDHIFTLAQGIPLGGSFDYLDDGTLAMSFKMRNKYA